jgi:hypothetical protein
LPFTFLSNKNYMIGADLKLPADFDCQTSMSGSVKFACSDIDENFLDQDMAQHETTLSLRDSDGFYKALANIGISPDWVDFGDYELRKEISATHFNALRVYKFANFPIMNATLVVPNPKDIVTKGLGSISNLRDSMTATLLDMILGQWMDGSIADPAQAYSAPVFMLMEAVDSMAQAKALGQKEEQEEAEEAKRKKDFILLIISVVFLVSHSVKDNNKSSQLTYHAVCPLCRRRTRHRGRFGVRRACHCHCGRGG